MKIDWKREAEGAKRIVRIGVLLFTTAVAATFGWMFATIVFAVGVTLPWLIRDRLTTTTKRRLLVLAVALGLIAAAPQLFHAVVYFRPGMEINRGAWFSAGPFPSFDRSLSDNAVSFGIGPFFVEYISTREWGCIFRIYRPGESQDRVRFRPPHEAITLRLTFAGALASVWLLVVSIRARVRSWRRTGTN